MKRPLAVIVLLGITNLGWSQDGPAGRVPLVDQFDGKELKGWEIEGEGKIEGGVIKLGGRSEAKLRLTAPLGDQVRLRLEYQLAPEQNNLPKLVWEADGNTQWLWGLSTRGQWMELDVNGGRGGFWRAFRLNYSFGNIPGPGEGRSGGSGMFHEVGGHLCRLVILVPPDAALTIRKIALHTTASPPPTSGPGIALVVMALVLAGVIALGWFLNRGRGASSAAAKS